jgi:hypothetical protein
VNGSGKRELLGKFKNTSSDCMNQSDICGLAVSRFHPDNDGAASGQRVGDPFDANGFTFEVTFAYDADRSPAR